MGKEQKQRVSSSKYEIRCTEFLLLFAGVFSQVKLVESGPDMVKPGESIKLSCTVTGFTITRGYDWTWVRQTPSKGLQWMGYVTWNGIINLGHSFKSRISISKDDGKNEFYLTISCAATVDTAKYYCESSFVPQCYIPLQKMQNALWDEHNQRSYLYRSQPLYQN